MADIVEPRVVVNSADGSRTDTGSGKGTIVSSLAVVGRDQKRRLASAYDAIAVDMEGASVALGARAHGLEFAALKAISDELDFAMPPMNQFVSHEGKFGYARFAMHVALRPWLWGRTIALARNSLRASRALCAAVEGLFLKRGELNSRLDDEGRDVLGKFVAVLQNLLWQWLRQLGADKRDRPDSGHDEGCGLSRRR